MKNRRHADRSYTYAKVVIVEFDEIGYMRDMSPTGVRIELFTAVELEPEMETIATIIPHQDLDIPPFNMHVQVRWIGENGPTTSVGLLAKEFQTKEGKEYYRRLLEVFNNIKKKNTI